MCAQRPRSLLSTRPRGHSTCCGARRDTKGDLVRCRSRKRHLDEMAGRDRTTGRVEASKECADVAHETPSERGFVRSSEEMTGPARCDALHAKPAMPSRSVEGGTMDNMYNHSKTYQPAKDYARQTLTEENYRRLEAFCERCAEVYGRVLGKRYVNEEFNRFFWRDERAVREWG